VVITLVFDAHALLRIGQVQSRDEAAISVPHDKLANRARQAVVDERHP
jgi:hypothetical protein